MTIHYDLATKRYYDLTQYRNAIGVGGGNFGKVFRVESLQNRNYIYAFKQIKLNNQEDLDKAKMEMELHLEISCRAPKFIINFFGYEHKEVGDDERVNVFLEYAPNGTVESIMRTAEMDFKTAVKLFKQLIFALRFCHSFEIIHGDVKPANMLLDKNGNLKLADFGLARKQNISKSKPLGQTKKYAAPEILVHRYVDGRAADVWAAVLTLFEMLTGRHPWRVAEISVTKYDEWVQGKTNFFEHPWNLLGSQMIQFFQKGMCPDPFRRAKTSWILENFKPTRAARRVLPSPSLPVPPPPPPPQPEVHVAVDAPEVSVQPRRGPPRRIQRVLPPPPPPPQPEVEVAVVAQEDPAPLRRGPERRVKREYVVSTPVPEKKKRVTRK